LKSAGFGSDWLLRALREGEVKDVVRFIKPADGEPTYELGEGFTAEDALRELAKALPWPPAVKW
jgi:hypothetical protein